MKLLMKLRNSLTPISISAKVQSSWIFRLLYTSKEFTVYCCKCGTKIESSDIFCLNCGTKVHPPTPIVTTPSINLQQYSIEKNDQKSEASRDQSKSFFGGVYHPWRRLFARTVDIQTFGILNLMLFSMLIGFCLPPGLLGLYLKMLENPIAGVISLYLLWLPVEAVSLSLLGTTPAKWVFGIRVLKPTGEKISFSAALKRGVLVWTLGEGLGIILAISIAQYVSYRRLTKTGTTYWDATVGSVVTHKKWGVFRTIASVALVFVAALIFGVMQS